jgi:hypothetical protein
MRRAADPMFIIAVLMTLVGIWKAGFEWGWW